MRAIVVPPTIYSRGDVTSRIESKAYIALTLDLRTSLFIGDFVSSIPTILTRSKLRYSHLRSCTASATRAEVATTPMDAPTLRIVGGVLETARRRYRNGSD